MSIGFLTKLSDFINTTTSKLPNIEMNISVEFILEVIENLRKKPKLEAPKLEKEKKLPQSPEIK